MNTEKPKVTLPLKVGQKVIWNYSKGATYPGRVVLTDLRNQDQCSVLVVYGADGGDEFAGRLLADGTLPGTAACLVWLTDPPDPREDLIPGRMTDHNELRALALAATPGPWRAKQRNKQEAIYIVGPDHTPPACHAFYANNADYIAAAHPATVLALLDELDAARDLIQYLPDEKMQAELHQKAADDEGLQESNAPARTYQIAGKPMPMPLSEWPADGFVWTVVLSTMKLQKIAVERARDLLDIGADDTLKSGLVFHTEDDAQMVLDHLKELTAGMR